MKDVSHTPASIAEGHEPTLRPATWIQLDANHWAHGVDGYWAIKNGINVPREVLANATRAANAHESLVAALMASRDFLGWTPAYKSGDTGAHKVMAEITAALALASDRTGA